MLTPEQIQEAIIHDIPTNYEPPSWDVWFMQMVYHVASKSKDRSTKIGAVIVDPNHSLISVGYNGMPQGVNDDVPGRQDRPRKYFFYEHGERNAIYQSTVPLDNCTLYTQGLPCADCGRAIIRKRIKRVVVHQLFDQICDHLSPHWNESCQASKEMFDESGVEVVYMTHLLGVTAYIRGQVCSL
jgi:dCMP deaminase